MRIVEKRRAINTLSAEEGELPIVVPAGGMTSVSFKSDPQQHVGLVLLFDEPDAPITMSVSRTESGSEKLLGADKSGLGRRMLSVFDPGDPREYLVDISTTGARVSCVLSIIRTNFADASTCNSDCGRLLQLPLPSNQLIDGYRPTTNTLFRYQFGRRDLIMFVRHVAHTMRQAGYGLVIPLDLSQWDGDTPGMDVGKPRHHSHKRGRDVDLSLFDNSATARLRAYCDTMPSPEKGLEPSPGEYIYSRKVRSDASSSGQLVCRSGRVHDFNAYAIAQMLGLFFETRAVTLSFLDHELLLLVKEAAQLTLRDGLITPKIAALFADGIHLQHWPNHIDHIHIRVRETGKQSNVRV